jgi:hypothetical protein
VTAADVRLNECLDTLTQHNCTRLEEKKIVSTMGSQKLCMIIRLVKSTIQEMVPSIINTCGRSSTLPVGSLGVLEQAQMGSNIHLKGRHRWHRHGFRTACVHRTGRWPKETQAYVLVCTEMTVMNEPTVPILSKGRPGARNTTHSRDYTFQLAREWVYHVSQGGRPAACSVSRRSSNSKTGHLESSVS